MKTLFEPTDCLSLPELQSYQKGHLRGSAARKVEAHLVDCPLCNGALEGLNNSSRPVADAKQLRSLPYRKRNKLFHPSRVAAILVVGLIALAALYFWPGQTTDSLFNSYYQTPQATHFHLRSTAPTPPEKSTQAALDAFQQKDFEQAILLLNQYLKEQPNDHWAYFWKGISHLEMGDPSLAIPALQRTREGNNEQYEKASWYLLLAYLQKEENRQALQVAKDLMKRDSTAYEASLKDIRKKLERLSGQ